MIQPHPIYKGVRDAHRKNTREGTGGIRHCRRLVFALPLPSQAQEKSFAGKSQSHADPHYLDNKHDMRIRLDVKWELSMSPYVDADHIKVTVRDGVVTLRGSVEDQSAVNAAIENAKEAGAKKVISHLTTEEKK